MIAASYIAIGGPGADRLVAAYAAGEDHCAADRYQRSIRRRQTLVGRALLRATLERKTRRPGFDWHFSYGRGGKLVAHTSCGDQPVGVSVAHCRDIAVCAVSDGGPIGIDVEDPNRIRPFSALAGAAFGPAEQQTVINEGPTAFYRIWTLREALAKATGEGFSMLVNCEDFFADSPLDGRWVSRAKAACFIFAVTLVEGRYAVALALPIAPGAPPSLVPSEWLVRLPTSVD